MLFWVAWDGWKEGRLIESYGGGRGNFRGVRGGWEDWRWRKGGLDSDEGEGECWILSLGIHAMSETNFIWSI